MRISDWSSDVCSSDLVGHGEALGVGAEQGEAVQRLDHDAAVQQHLVEARRSALDEGRIGAGDGGEIGDLQRRILPARAAGEANAVAEQLLLELHERRSALVDQLRHPEPRSEEHTSELQSLMRISYAVFCLKKKRI